MSSEKIVLVILATIVCIVILVYLGVLPIKYTVHYPYKPQTQVQEGFPFWTIFLLLGAGAIGLYFGLRKYRAAGKTGEEEQHEEERPEERRIETRESIPSLNVKYRSKSESYLDKCVEKGIRLRVGQINGILEYFNKIRETGKVVSNDALFEKFLENFIKLMMLLSCNKPCNVTLLSKFIGDYRDLLKGKYGEGILREELLEEWPEIIISLRQCGSIKKCISHPFFTVERDILCEIIKDILHYAFREKRDFITRFLCLSERLSVIEDFESYICELINRGKLPEERIETISNETLKSWVKDLRAKKGRVTEIVDRTQSFEKLELDVNGLYERLLEFEKEESIKAKCEVDKEQEKRFDIKLNNYIFELNLNRISVTSVAKLLYVVGHKVRYKKSVRNVRYLYVVGDLHGDWISFSKIIADFRRNAHNSIIIFLGDYADRGIYGLEIIEELIKLKEEEYGDRIILLRGNHEDYDEEGGWYWSPCDLPFEVKEKRKKDWKSYFKEYLYPEFFSKLNIAAILEGFALFVHGGISSKIKSLKDLEKPSREIYKDILWSDPVGEDYGEYPSHRGVGVLFSKEITENVLRNLNVQFLIRSHEPQKAFNGIFIEHDGKVITISSTTVYGGRAAYLKLDLNNLPKSGEDFKKYLKIL